MDAGVFYGDTHNTRLSGDSDTFTGGNTPPPHSRQKKEELLKKCVCPSRPLQHSAVCASSRSSLQNTSAVPSPSRVHSFRLLPSLSACWYSSLFTSLTPSIPPQPLHSAHQRAQFKVPCCVLSTCSSPGFPELSDSNLQPRRRGPDGQACNLNESRFNRVKWQRE